MIAVARAGAQVKYTLPDGASAVDPSVALAAAAAADAARNDGTVGIDMVAFATAPPAVALDVNIEAHVLAERLGATRGAEALRGVLSELLVRGFGLV